MIQLSRRTVALALAAFLAVAGLATAGFVRTLAPAEAGQIRTFSDVGIGTFFYPSVEWLASNGIADGFNDGRFYPNSNITRGQASYWFANYNNGLELVTGGGGGVVGTNFTVLSDPCPSGKRPVAGGGSVGGGGGDVFMARSYPELDSNQWAVSWATDNDTPLNPGTLTVWALCVPETIP